MRDDSSERIFSPIRSAMESLRSTLGRERQFRDVFHRSTLPMVLVENERRYLDANYAARLLFRLNLRELRRLRIDDLTPSRMVGALQERWAQLQNDGEVSGRYVVLFPEGSPMPIVYSARANVLPGQHLIVFMPSDWSDDELVFPDSGEPAPALGPLTSREREVLTLIATGAPLSQVATELTIAPTTARTHVQNALRKLGARNRAHAAALAVHDGLIEFPRRNGRA